MQNDLKHTAPGGNAAVSSHAATSSAPTPPQPPRMRSPAPPLRKNPPSAPDAPDDSTQTHAAHDGVPSQVAPALDVGLLLPTTDKQLPHATPFEGLSMPLKPWWPKLAPLFRSGVLAFVVGRSDDRPYLLCRGSGVTGH